jgi:hypothetical protein
MDAVVAQATQSQQPAATARTDFGGGFIVGGDAFGQAKASPPASPPEEQPDWGAEEDMLAELQGGGSQGPPMSQHEQEIPDDFASEMGGGSGPGGNAGCKFGAAMATQMKAVFRAEGMASSLGSVHALPVMHGLLLQHNIGAAELCDRWREFAEKNDLGGASCHPSNSLNLLQLRFWCLKYGFMLRGRGRWCRHGHNPDVRPRGQGGQARVRQQQRRGGRGASLLTVRRRGAHRPAGRRAARGLGTWRRGPQPSRQTDWLRGQGARRLVTEGGTGREAGRDQYAAM